MNVIPSIDPSSNVTDCRFHSFFLGWGGGRGHAPSHLDSKRVATLIIPDTKK